MSSSGLEMLELLKLLSRLPSPSISIGLPAAAMCIFGWEYMITMPLSLRLWVVRDKRLNVSTVWFPWNESFFLWTVWDRINHATWRLRTSSIGIVLLGLSFALLYSVPVYQLQILVPQLLGWVWCYGLSWGWVFGRSKWTNVTLNIVFPLFSPAYLSAKHHSSCKYRTKLQKGKVELMKKKSNCSFFEEFGSLAVETIQLYW